MTTNRPAEQLTPPSYELLERRRAHWLAELERKSEHPQAFILQTIAIIEAKLAAHSKEPAS